MWEEKAEECFNKWMEVHKPKRKRRVESDSEWIASLKVDPELAGLDVDKEIAKCRFWCRNQPTPILASRKRIINWLNKADRTVALSPDPAPPRKEGPIPEPANWQQRLKEADANHFCAKGNPTWPSIFPYYQKEICRMIGEPL
jgi:hypothetical protein